jgi:predicted  nucleic acid-binding Zn-ribbon protein
LETATAVREQLQHELTVVKDELAVATHELTAATTALRRSQDECARVREQLNAAVRGDWEKEKEGVFAELEKLRREIEEREVVAAEEEKRLKATLVDVVSHVLVLILLACIIYLF